MSDPIRPLRMATIFIAIWSILYCLAQLGIMAWQLKEVKGRQAEYENRQLPANGYVDGFQARFPGLYAIYTETPDRRKTNAMYVIVIVNIILTFLHLPLSVLLLYGAWKLYANCVWPWMGTAFPVIIMATAYAVLWWSGDIFNEQLTMSVVEFVMSLAINGICLVVVIFFYARLRGSLQSTRPAQHRRQHAYLDASGNAIPPWRAEWTEEPPKLLKKKLRRQRNREERQSRPRSRSKSPQKVYSIRRKSGSRQPNYAPAPGPAEPLQVAVPPRQDFPMYFPYGTGNVHPGYPYPVHPQEVYDPKSGYPCAKFPNHPRNVYEGTFPWNPPPEPTSKKVKEEELKPPPRAEAIMMLYAERFPEEFSRKKSSIRSPFARRRSPERVSFSRQGPLIHVRSPEQTPSDPPMGVPEKHSVI